MGASVGVVLGVVALVLLAIYLSLTVYFLR